MDIKDWWLWKNKQMFLIGYGLKLNYGVSVNHISQWLWIWKLALHRPCSPQPSSTDFSKWPCKAAHTWIHTRILEDVGRDNWERVTVTHRCVNPSPGEEREKRQDIPWHQRVVEGCRRKAISVDEPWLMNFKSPLYSSVLMLSLCRRIAPVCLLLWKSPIPSLLSIHNSPDANGDLLR